MKWSFKIGRILGIDVFLHFTFLLLLGFIAASTWLATGSLASVLEGVFFFLALFACVLLHEYGHALMARRYGVTTRDIILLPIGGVARLERMPDNPRQELWVALAGPAVNVVIAAVLALGLALTGSWPSLTSLSPTSGGLVERLLIVNVMLVLFNLLPAFPMDGGRVMRALLALRMDYARATRIAATVGQGMALVFAFIGLFSNFFLLLIAVFIWMGASQEAAATEMKASLGHLPVRAAMVTHYRTLTPHDTLGDATRLLLEGAQQDFPVLEGERVVGVLTHDRLFAVLRERGEWTSVAEAMTREFRAVQVDALLETALGQNAAGLNAVPVLRGDRLVGLLTSENVSELLMIRAAQNRHRTQPPPLPPPLPFQRPLAAR